MIWLKKKLQIALLFKILNWALKFSSIFLGLEAEFYLQEITSKAILIHFPL